MNLPDIDNGGICTYLNEVAKIAPQEVIKIIFDRLQDTRSENERYHPIPFNRLNNIFTNLDSLSEFEDWFTNAVNECLGGNYQYAMLVRILISGFPPKVVTLVKEMVNRDAKRYITLIFDALLTDKGNLIFNCPDLASVILEGAHSVSSEYYQSAINRLIVGNGPLVRTITPEADPHDIAGKEKAEELLRFYDGKDDHLCGLYKAAISQYEANIKRREDGYDETFMW